MSVWILLLLVGISGCKKNVATVYLPVEYIPVVGETVAPYVGNFDPVESFLAQDQVAEIKFKSVRRTILLYPREVFWGDTIYAVEFLENISGASICDFDKTLSDVWDMPDFSIWISSPQISGEYRWSFENPTDATACHEAELSTFEIGDKFCSRIVYPEICPLEDFDAPFWKELREKLTPEGIVCTIHLEVNSADGFTATQEILVKPRPSEEMALLEKWYKNTPKELFPFNYKGELPNSGKSNIRLSSFSSRSYNPWLFMRVGNRKPSDPNNPQTLQGWRNLEASLIPSTMRDEVRLARFRLEYFAARDADEANKIKKDYWDWLDSLPEVQRTVMENYPYFSSSSEKDAEVWRKLSGLRRK